MKPQLPYYAKDGNTIIEYFIKDFDWGVARMVKYKTKKGEVVEATAQVLRIFALEDKIRVALDSKSFDSFLKNLEDNPIEKNDKLTKLLQRPNRWN